MRTVGYVNGDPNSLYITFQYNKLNYLIYEQSMVTSASDATLIDGQGTGFALLTTIKNYAKAINPKIKVLCSLIGGNWSVFDEGHLTAIMANATYRATLATNLAGLVTTYGLDGVDIDWEGTDINQAQYHALLDALRTAMPTKIITCAMPSAPEYQPAIDYAFWLNPADDGALIDGFNVMSYGLSVVNYEAYVGQYITNSFPLSKVNAGYSSVEDDIDLIDEKVAWAKANSFGGQMLWTVDTVTDSEALLNKIYLNMAPALSGSGTGC